MATTTNDDKGLFWNSQGGDRKYNANSLGEWLSAFFNTGVLPSDFEVTAPGNNMNVTLHGGYAFIENPNSSNTGGKAKRFKDDITFTVELADSTKPRIDTIVIERNDNDRDVTAKLITGIAATTPIATAPVRTSSVYQLVVAEIYVGANVTSISNANITRKVADPAVCGLVTGTVSNNSMTYGTTDLTPGVSELADGTFYFVCE